jgi:uncharacterized protein (TIGR04255 family)
MLSTPSKVERDTIFECVFEVRFSEGHPSADDLLPGMLFQSLGKHFSRTVPQQIGQVPKQFRNLDPNLTYLASHALEADNMRMMIGSRVAAIAFPKPYMGWEGVRPLILECFEAVQATKLIGPIERLGLKYTNLLDVGSDENDLGQLQIDLKLNGFDYRRSGLVIKSEIERNDCVGIVQILTGAKATVVVKNRLEESKGVLLSVDVYRDGPFLNFSDELPNLLDILHSTEKELFFGLLAPETLQKLNPSWSQKGI